MTNVRFAGMRIAVLLGDNSEQVEMTEPRKALEAVCASTTLSSPVQGHIHGVADDRDLLNADSTRMLPKVQQFVWSIQ